MPLQKLPVTSLDDINHRRRSRETLNQILDHSFDDSKVRTSVEVAAGITPINAAYPPGYPERYGTNSTPGTTNMTAAINAAFKVAKTGGGAVVMGTTWPYLVTTPIDCTQDVGADNYAFVVRNVGQAHAVTDSAPAYPLILANHTGHVFDCSGAAAITWYDVSVGQPSGASEKKTCWFLARNSGGASMNHRFYNCRARGTYSKAVLYNYGGEENQIDGCMFVNDSTTAGTKVVTITQNNIDSLSSTFITIATGARSTRGHVYVGSSFYNFNQDNAADCIQIESSHDIAFFAPFMYCAGRAFFFLNGVNGATDRLKITAFDGEPSSPLPDFGIYMSAHAVTHTYLDVDGYFPSGTRAIKGDTGAVLSNSRIGPISESTSKGLEMVTRLQQSTVDGVSVIVLGESKQNNLFGDTSGFTITTRNNDNWHETGAANTTWTPGTGAITHGGTLTVGNKRLSLEGKKMFFSFSLSDSVSMSWAARTQITGLPFSAAIVSADVTVTIYDTGVSLGNGFVEGTTIKLPANAGVGAGIFVLISGSAYVA